MAEQRDADFLENAPRRYDRRTFLSLGLLFAEPAAAAGNLIEAKVQSDDFTFEVLKNPNTSKTIIVAPAMQNDGVAVSRLLGPKLQEVANVITIVYPTSDTSLSMPILAENVMDVMRQNNVEQPSFLGISLGGLINAKLLPYFHAAKQEFGQPETFACDSSPFGIQHARKDQVALAKLAQHARYSGAISTIKAALYASALPDRTDHEPGLSDELVETHFNSIINSKLWVTASQADFLQANTVEPGSLAGIAKSVRYIITRNDPLVNCEEAARYCQLMFGNTPVESIVAPQRPIDRHACSTDFPSGTVKIFANDLAD